MPCWLTGGKYGVLYHVKTVLNKGGGGLFQWHIIIPAFSYCMLSVGTFDFVKLRMISFCPKLSFICIKNNTKIQGEGLCAVKDP